MNRKLEGTLSVALTLAAIVIAVGVAKREFFPTAVSATQASTPPPAVYMANWKEALPFGTAIGDTAAPVKIVVLSDVECPACRDFYFTVRDFMKSVPGAASEVYLHYPLRSHRFARPGAQLAECAKDQGKLPAVLDALYTRQDALGLVSWGSIAREAGVLDTARVVKCALSKDRFARIDDGLGYGAKIGLQFTPTIIVNGWRLANTPNTPELTRIVEALRRGQAPFDTLSHTR